MDDYQNVKKGCQTNNPTSHCKNCSYKELTPILDYVKKQKHMKPHLHKVERRIDYTDKSEYNFILNQSERSQPIQQSYYTKFIRSLKQEDFNIIPIQKTSKKKYVNFIM